MCTRAAEVTTMKSRRTLSRFGLVCGIFAMTMLLVAFVSGSWLYTDEPILLPNSTRLSFSIGITIGLWTVCPYMKKINTTLHFTSPTCSLIKYKNWDSVEYSGLEVSDTLELAQVVVSRLRSCTMSCGSAIILIILAVLLALLGHVNGDKKIVIACGIFILAGLSLGTGLVIFITYLTETLLELQHSNKELHFVYHYGWCFYLACLAFLLTNVAALLSILGYLDTFPSVDEMVKHMVPGGERKLQQQVFKNGTQCHPCIPSTQQYDLLSSSHFRLDSNYGPITSDTPPDVCTTSYCPSNSAADYNSATSQETYYEGPSMAGQTVPITVKNYNRVSSPLSGGVPLTKYEIVHHSGMAMENSISNICQDENSAVRQQRLAQQVKSETLQVFEPGLLNFGSKRTKKRFFGSAV